MFNLTNQQMGNNIRKWRRVYGYEQKDFSDLIGIAKSTLSKIENGRQGVSMILLQKIAECLKIKVTQLYSDPKDLLPPTAIIHNHNV